MTLTQTIHCDGNGCEAYIEDTTRENAVEHFDWTCDDRGDFCEICSEEMEEGGGLMEHKCEWCHDEVEATDEAVEEKRCIIKFCPKCKAKTWHVLKVEEENQ